MKKVIERKENGFFHVVHEIEVSDCVALLAVVVVFGIAIITELFI